jgi:Aminoglycoside-2''-adenylyltransferase
VDLPSQKSWRTLTPHEALELLSVLRMPWWVAGGWALELFLGKVTRAHKDLDIGIFRSDSAGVVAALQGWEFFEAKDGVLSALAVGDAPRAEVNSLWGKRVNAAQWELELMLDASDVECWRFRRDARITRPLASAIRRNPEGIAYLAPEIQLLYKARATRPARSSGLRSRRSACGPRFAHVAKGISDEY